MGSVTVWRVLLCLQAALLCAANIPPSLPREVESRVIVKLGKALKLDCPVDSRSHFYTQWKKDGQSLNPTSFRIGFKGDENKLLRIKPVQMNDAGVYMCTATNGYGSVTFNYTVVVKDEENQVFQEGNRQFKLSDVDIRRQGSKPTFENFQKMREEQRLLKPRGSSIAMSCRVDGNPEPEVHWLRNGQPFDELQQSNQMAKLRNNQAVLRLSSLSDKDDGQYTCVAVNRLGQVNFTYTLDVVGEISSKPRLIAPHPINQTAAVGTSVSFHCYVQSDESDEKPDVGWLKRVDDDEEVPNPVTYNGEKFQVLQNAGQWLRERLPDGSYLNKLVLRNVQPSDEGMFVCSATNRVGFETRKAFLSIKPGHGSQGSYNVPHSTYLDSSNNPSIRDPSMSSPQDDGDREDDHPWLIPVTVCAVIVLVIVAIVCVIYRNNRCRKSPLTPPAPAAPRPPVPPHEREAYYYSNCSQHHMQQQQQAVNPLLMSSREKMAPPPKMMVITPTPSGELTGGSSDFSSVSRTHPSSNTVPHYYHHNHLNYGY